MSYDILKSLVVDGDTCGNFRTVADDACVSLDAVLAGIGAIGDLIWRSSTNEQNPLTDEQLPPIGRLLEHLAGEAMHFSEIRHCAEYQLDKQPKATTAGAA